ncbi:hypothetical protein [Calidithermus chliarophilus]|uniref:hypothetical protein n=1 Tax=Calidithermus chliarophilus TaxID=52023 RepID=UPI0012F6A4BD|nr:hypothetical protein [Calidithermus chliarophilus]
MKMQLTQLAALDLYVSRVVWRLINGEERAYRFHCTHTGPGGIWAVVALEPFGPEVGGPVEGDTRPVYRVVGTFTIARTFLREHPHPIGILESIAVGSPGEFILIFSFTTSGGEEVAYPVRIRGSTETEVMLAGPLEALLMDSSVTRDHIVSTVRRLHEATQVALQIDSSSPA